MGPDVIITENNNINYNIDPYNNVAVYIGEFEKGPINEPKFVTDILQFKQMFGRAREFNYNHWYQVYNFLQYAKGIYVCRTAGEIRINAEANSTLVNSSGEWGNIFSIEIYKSSDWNNSKYLREVFNKEYLNKEYLVVLRRLDVIVEFFSLNTADELNSFYLQNINLECGTFKFENGYTERASDLNFAESYNLFTKEDYEIDIIIADEDHNLEAIKLAESRRDCVAFLGLPRKYIETIKVNENTLVTENGLIIYLGMNELKYVLNAEDYSLIDNYINSLPKSNYAFFVIGFAVINDGFTNKNRIVNLIADVAGLKVKQSYNNPWSVGIGVEKGTVNYEAVTLLINKKWSSSLYKKGVNSFEKNTLMTQKLFIDKPNLINRLYQRNILNYIERITEKMVRKYIFYINNRSTRGNIAGNLKILLDEIISMKGLEAAKVQVSPNSEDSIIINITIKLPSVSEYIVLRMQNVGTKIFSEVIGG